MPIYEVTESGAKPCGTRALQKISVLIVNEVKHVNCVMCDVKTKQSATIE